MSIRVLLAVLRVSLVPTDAKLMFKSSVLLRNVYLRCGSSILRESVLGHLGVVAGRLVVSPPWIYARTCDLISGQVGGVVDDLK